MSARIYALLSWLPAVLLVVSLLSGGSLSPDPCPSGSGGGC
jgi:hypothetical protein